MTQQQTVWRDTTAGSGTILGNYAQIFEAGVQSPGVHLHPGGVIESEVATSDSGEMVAADRHPLKKLTQALLWKTRFQLGFAMIQQS